jgi:hypothetical protein
MRADWDRALILEATTGSLTFTDAQIRRILAFR